MSKHPILDHSDSLRAAATRLQLDCLDTVWLGWSQHYRFSCPKGHITLRKPSKLIKRKKSCRECEIDQFAERLRAAALDAGVIWLDQRWQAVTAHYRFGCQCGHTWERTGYQALHACGCPQCNPQKRGAYGLTQLVRIAAERGGACLSQQAQTGDVRYRFRCAQGHRFQMLGSRLLMGGWCSRCAQVKGWDKDWERLQAMCQSRGGRCLSVEFAGYDVRHVFRCGAGHDWETTFTDIVQGNWCRRCQLTPEPMILDTAHEQARRYGGRCLSTIVPRRGERLQWACGAGHGWSSSLNRILRGHWCAECLKTDRSTLRNAQVANARQVLGALLEKVEPLREKRPPAKSFTNGRKKYQEPLITEHPILDRSPELRSAATRLQLDCVDTQWAGINALYRFVCQKGHLSSRSLTSLLTVIKGCRECRIDQLTDELRAISQGANVTWLDPRWLGTLEIHSFRCQQGHSWERTGARAMQTRRCPECVHKRGNSGREGPYLQPDRT